MRFFGNLAIATAMATATVTAAAIPAAAHAQGKQAQPSNAFVEQYNAIANALNEGNAAAAKSTFETMASGMTNDQERYLAGKIAIQIAKRSNPVDEALLQRGAGYIIASSATPAEERGPAAIDGATSAYNSKNYQAALTFAQQAEQANAATPQLRYVSSLSELALGRISGFDSMRTALGASNGAAEEQWYALTAQYALNWDKTGADAAKANEELTYWTQALAKHFPSANNWRSALGSFTNTLASPSDDLLEDVYRLRGYTGSLSNAGDFNSYLRTVTRADQILRPNEAIRFLNAGVQAGQINASDAFVRDALASAERGKAEDESNASSLERSAVSSKNVSALKSVADRALDQGRYDRAIELYDMAVAAGFNADIAAIRKGVAHYGKGDMAAAKSSFESVSGAGASGLADYWILFIDQRGAAGS